MLFKSPHLQRDELDVIQEIAGIHERLKLALSAPSRWGGVLRRNTFARAIRGSNSIEGYLVTKDDAVAAVEGQEPLKATESTWREILGYRNALTFVLQLAKDPSLKMNDGIVRSLHYMMLQHDLRKHPGNWRPGPIYVRDNERDRTVYEAPLANSVPKLMDELVSYLKGPKDGDHILVKGAMAHLNLVMIHPFSDGNGRMGRCLQTLILAAHIADPTFSSVEEYLGRNTQTYYKVLANVGQGSWNPRNDTREWIRFNLTAHYRQAATALDRANIMSRLSDEIELEVQARGLHERSHVPLINAAMGFTIRSAQYQQDAQVSAVVASRDLRTLVEQELLAPQGEKRGRIYFGSEYLTKIYGKVCEAEIQFIPDPFREQAPELRTES